MQWRSAMLGQSPWDQYTAPGFIVALGLMQFFPKPQIDASSFQIGVIFHQAVEALKRIDDDLVFNFSFLVETVIA